ncbi:MAG: preprotein translocase subunit YajC [Prevotella sp.]|nr:preprotein translocase subunit YajC [Prevotella sp.]
MNSIVMAAQAANGAGSSLPMLFMMLAIFAIMWYFMIRPQQQRQKKIREFQNSLKEGTKVVTGGGIYGTVKHIDLATNTVEVEIARGVLVQVDKAYVFADASSQVTNA